MHHLSTKSSRTAISVALLSAVAMVLAGCAPGSTSSNKTSTSAAASTAVPTGKKITLTEWDQETQPPQSTVVDTLNKEFEQKYPNVTIKRVSRSFNDLKTTLRLALTSNNPPDVVEANQGYPDMGSFVQAGLLTPMSDYANLYGWYKRFPKSLLQLNSFSPDGKTWHTGNLYGVSMTGEAIGVYYNTDLLRKAGVTPPTTFDAFTASLPKLKAAGILPISYGGATKGDDIHNFGLIQANVVGADAVNNLIFATGGAWTDPGNLKAATIFQDWARMGYLTHSSNGVDETQAANSFGQGEAAYLIEGPWEAGIIAHGPAVTSIRYSVLKTTTSSSGPVTEGGEGLAWAITSKSRNPNVSAAYINFLTNDHASHVMATLGSLPVVAPSDVASIKRTQLEKDVAAGFNAVTANDGLVPYLDYTTPTFFDTITAADQELVGLQITPKQYTELLQKDYSAFLKSRK